MNSLPSMLFGNRTFGFKDSELFHDFFILISVRQNFLELGNESTDADADAIVAGFPSLEFFGYGQRSSGDPFLEKLALLSGLDNSNSKVVGSNPASVE